ncbi:hypothetical protein GQ55_7G115100 [Panicum hallii var. hallii]|uniref:Uncharacterized protein n=1 Tax=Panicum hallii var. hallii TaxID=1504633 RepID=A0A2T7CUC0_9POAL|nr:hypothetical protein GQ55_7G115100 [Panicum hallii var. hallii]
MHGLCFLRINLNIIVLTLHQFLTIHKFLTLHHSVVLAKNSEKEKDRHRKSMIDYLLICFSKFAVNHCCNNR